MLSFVSISFNKDFYYKSSKFLIDFTQLIKDLDEKVKKDVSSLKGSVDKTVQAINDRVNNLITQNNPTEGNSELQDIRLGAGNR